MGRVSCWRLFPCWNVLVSFDYSFQPSCISNIFTVRHCFFRIRRLIITVLCLFVHSPADLVILAQGPVKDFIPVHSTWSRPITTRYMSCHRYITYYLAHQHLCGGKKLEFISVFWFVFLFSWVEAKKLITLVFALTLMPSQPPTGLQHSSVTS